LLNFRLHEDIFLIRIASDHRLSEFLRVRQEIFDVVIIKAAFLLLAELIFEVGSYLLDLDLLTVYIQLLEDLHRIWNDVVVERFLHQLLLEKPLDVLNLGCRIALKPN
jgi:hypothetical protein